MVSMDISFSVRLLSWVYVNIWIPIRLMYLRTKIAMRPVTKAACEMLALLNMVWCFVPISMMMISAEIISGLAEEWLRLVCLGYEKALGVEPGLLYEKTQTIDILIPVDVDHEEDEDQEDVDASDDKNTEEEAINESTPTVTDDEEMMDVVDE